MSKIQFDQAGKHFYETGTDQVVVYPQAANGTYPKGIGWDGVTGYTESPSGADETALYADNIKYLSLRGKEDFGATLTAYQYPDEFAVLDGSASDENIPGLRLYQQARKSFGLAVRSLIGNDIDGNDHSEELHLVYGLTASPSSRDYKTVNESPEAIEFSWELKSIPANVSKAVGGNVPKPTSLITIDKRKVAQTTWDNLLAKLYGTDGSVSYNEVDNPTPDSYTAAEPVGTENPKTEGWYERSVSEPYVYTLTTDESVVAGKTYYIKTTGQNPSSLGWYEKNAQDQYVSSVDTSVDTSKTYYTRTETGGTDPYLPLPDEIIEMLTVTTGG